jgi:two-component system alkaline phosphatase synthesis response regulator PhoP
MPFAKWGRGRWNGSKKKSGSGGKRKVLMVDDEEKFTSVTRRSLEVQGHYEVRVENKATNALEAAREFKPDLILLDVMMPDGDGGEVASKIMGDPELKDTPILFLTAAVKTAELDQGAGRIGGRIYIAKPVKLEHLINHIEMNIPA